MFRRNARYRTPLGVRCNERAERTRREGGKKRSTGLRNPFPPPPSIPQLGFYGRETRIEDPPRTSGILMKFLPLPSAKRKGEREGEESLFLLKTIHREGFDSIGRLYSSMNRGK